MKLISIVDIEKLILQRKINMSTQNKIICKINLIQEVQYSQVQELKIYFKPKVNFR